MPPDDDTNTIFLKSRDKDMLDALFSIAQKASRSMSRITDEIELACCHMCGVDVGMSPNGLPRTKFCESCDEEMKQLERDLL